MASSPAHGRSQSPNRSAFKNVLDILSILVPESANQSLNTF